MITIRRYENVSSGLRFPTTIELDAAHSDFLQISAKEVFFSSISLQKRVKLDPDQK
jgi:hypothetical protein